MMEKILRMLLIMPGMVVEQLQRWIFIPKAMVMIMNGIVKLDIGIESMTPANQQRNNGGDMKVHFTLEEMKNIIEKNRADERERCIQAIEYAHDDDYTDWKEIAIEAIKAE